MKGYVYVLQNTKGTYYVGSTNDLARRVDEHWRGKNKATKYNGIWKLVFYKEYENVLDARKIEVKLKRFKRRDFIHRIVKEKEILTDP